MMKAKVRPDSRVGKAMKAMLDAGEVPGVLGYQRRDLLLPGGVPCHAHDVSNWASARGMELRPHDIVEIRLCLAALGVRESSEEPFRLPALDVARGRWSEATGWAHDFDDNRRSWRVLPAIGGWAEAGE
ncbi:hypothetical protein [Gemmobacter nectariphilus]|uniref:hypothetical protein n=1 Tax=Gemmobacter nectariphilus TaxID=220343 RepID=UPI0004850ABD|nr:hypothetical protein [Gemmobacter nectariphilus]